MLNAVGVTIRFGKTPFIVIRGNKFASKKYKIKNTIKNKIPIPNFFIFTCMII